MDSRPPLNTEISVRDFKDFYWLKKELTQFCKEIGLPTSGGKIELAQRIASYLETGKIGKVVSQKTKSTSSNFDWAKEPLSTKTLITDNYSNTENVRAFFVKEIGPAFKFNVKFMQWMKSHQGYTLGAAIKQWHDIKAGNKNNKAPKEIAPQFEYNTYLRDFMAGNPGATRSQGIALWKLKKGQRGDNKYAKSDWKLLKE